MEFSFSFSISPEQMIYAMGAITAILGGKFVLPTLRKNSVSKSNKK